MTTAAAFLAAVRGVPNHHVTKALSSLTPGTDWANCSKALMAEQFELAHSPRRKLGSASGYLARPGLLDKLARRAKARAAGQRGWESL